jgi:hypothetical protein
MTLLREEENRPMGERLRAIHKSGLCPRKTGPRQLPGVPGGGDTGTGFFRSVEWAKQMKT